MYLSNVCKALIALVMILMLAACASTTSDDAMSDQQMAGQMGADGSGGVQSQGLGERGGFYGRDQKFSEEEVMAKRVFYFAFDSNVVATADLPYLEAHAEYLLAHSDAKVVLEGNTDARGSREYNVALGERRAQAVAQILESYGVPSSQIRIVSYGAEKPAVLGHSEKAYAQNRRVEMIYE